MKRILFFFTFLLFFIFRSQAHANEGWVISNFQSDIQIQDSGEVLVSEIIGVDFNSLQKHGIYRDIPYIYEANGQKDYSEIDVINVLQNNADAEYTTSRNQDYIRIKIGSANELISGKNTYTINYKTRGILRSFSDHDELYWNVTGNYWLVPIQQASAKVLLPQDGISKIACYESMLGSNKACLSSMPNQKEALFTTNSPLGVSEGLTIVVGYNKGLVPILTISKPKTLLEKFFSWPSKITLLIVIISGAIMIMILWLRYGRDYWFSQKYVFDSNATSKIKPLGEHETIVVEFTPPDNLRPAEIGVLMDERADTLDVVATIIDLATQGFLTIKEVPKTWIFGKTDYILTKKENASTSNLLDFEKDLLNKIFKDSFVAQVSFLKTTFFQELREIKKKLYENIVAKKLFIGNPEKIRDKYLVFAIMGFFIGLILTFFGIKIDLILLADIGLGIAISGLLLLIVSRFMPRRTAHGREMYRRTKGYHLFISQAEKYRQQFFEEKNMFNEVLPYAIVFGLTEKFAKAMKNIGLDKPTTSWYIGTHAFNANSFGTSINSFSNSMSSAIASTPKGSGFSSGGGFSGGGFGGGGGGSW